MCELKKRKVTFLHFEEKALKRKKHTTATKKTDTG